jgi:hypothetical protein
MPQPEINQPAKLSPLRRALSLIRWRRSADDKKQRSELGTAIAGITLGLTCALFPWYVFYNQDQFGIRAMKFSGQGMIASGPSGMRSFPDRVGSPMSIEEAAQLPLDPFSTGTLPQRKRDGETPAKEVLDQPFPADSIPYRMVHATLGRAMIQDDGGLFVVQPGSKLPDNSKVKAIEQRGDDWVLVTSRDKVLLLEP